MNTVRIALQTYDALTDANIDHYSLYADSDNILIKEKVRGSGTLASGGLATIAHNLGYVPLVRVMARQTSGTVTDWFLCLAGQSEAQLVEAYLDTTNLYVKKLANGNTGEYKYYIFYDQQV